MHSFCKKYKNILKGTTVYENDHDFSLFLPSIDFLCYWNGNEQYPGQINDDFQCFQNTSGLLPFLIGQV